MSIKLIATDMDGTLLDEKGRYDRARFEALFTRMQNHGIAFVVASGNNSHRLRHLFNGLEDQMSFVAENGAHVIEYGKLFARAFIHQEIIQQALDFFANQHAAYRLVLTGEKGVYVREDAVFTYQGSPLTEEQVAELFSILTFVKDFDNLPDDQFVKMTIVVPVEKVEEILLDFNQKFKGKLRAVTSGFGAIDIVQEGIDKAWGIKQLMEKWGIESSQVMAFGDHDNDIEMLELAAHSYAMANASSTVQKIARYQAPSNKEEGVFQVIESYLNQVEGK